MGVFKYMYIDADKQILTCMSIKETDRPKPIL